MLPDGATPVSDRCYAFSFRLQGKVGNRITSKSTNHPATLQSKHISRLSLIPLFAGPIFCRQQRTITICLTQPFFDEDTVTILLALASDDPEFDWQAVKF